VRFALRPGEDARLLWMLTALVAVGGYYAIDSHYQQAIGRAGEATQQLYERVAANSRIIREAGRLALVQARVRADIAAVTKDQSPAATTSALLMMLATSAKRFHVQVKAVEPATPASTGAVAAAPIDGLIGTDMTIRVRGRFRNLLGFVEDLSHHGVLLAITDTQLAVTGNNDANVPAPDLDATVHATLYRIATDTSTSGGT
jgi:hypothetical protein